MWQKTNLMCGILATLCCTQCISPPPKKRVAELQTLWGCLWGRVSASDLYFLTSSLLRGSKIFLFKIAAGTTQKKKIKLQGYNFSKNVLCYNSITWLHLAKWLQFDFKTIPTVALMRWHEMGNNEISAPLHHKTAPWSWSQNVRRKTRHSGRA